MLTTDRPWSAPLFLTSSCAFWIWASSPLASRGAPWRKAMPRAPLVSCARLNVAMSSRIGTRPMCVKRFRCCTRMTKPLRRVLPSAPSTLCQASCRVRQRVATCNSVGGPRPHRGRANQVVRRRLQALRLDGDRLDKSLLAMFDSQLRSAVRLSLIEDLPDHSWWQGTTGDLFGGLGVRTAQLVAQLVALPRGRRPHPRLDPMSLNGKFGDNFAFGFGFGCPKKSGPRILQAVLCSWRPNSTVKMF